MSSAIEQTSVAIAGRDNGAAMLGVRGSGAGGAGMGATVLVADDDADMCALVRHHLVGAGFEVVEAADGEEVFTQLQHCHPMLFLLDGQMPGLSGFEVCQRLRADARYCDAPIIFMTGLTETEHVVRGFEVGGTDFVRKPVILPELIARIQTQVELAATRAAVSRRAALLEALTQDQVQRLEEVRSGQEQLLTSPADFADLDVAVEFRPAHVAGGDFYEIKRLSEDEVALFVSDVSGHDLSVPFVTGALKALTASFMQDVLSPAETMIQLNASLLRFLTPGRFVSAAYVRHCRASMTLDVINGGGPYPLLQRRGGPAEFLEVRGDVLGMFDAARFETLQLDVSAGDRLFLFTDGLTEGFIDERGRRGRALHGLEVVRARVEARRDQPLEEVVRAAVDDLFEQCDNVVEDDVVILGIECG